MPRKRLNLQKKLVAADPVVWLSLRHMADRLGCSVNDLCRVALMQLIVRHWDPITISMFPDEHRIQQLLTSIHEHNPEIKSIDHLRTYIIHKLNNLLDTLQSKTENRTEK